MLFEQASKSTLPDKPSEETMRKGLEHFLPGLNDEALALQILSHLTLGDLLKLSRVNTTWQRLIQDRQLWRQIWLNLKDKLTQGFLWQYFLQPEPTIYPSWMAYIQAVFAAAQNSSTGTVADSRLQRHSLLLINNLQAKEIQVYLNSLAQTLQEQKQVTTGESLEQSVAFSEDKELDYYLRVKYLLITWQFESAYMPWLVFQRDNGLFIKQLGIANYSEFLNYFKSNYRNLWLDEIQPQETSYQRFLVDTVHFYTNNAALRLLEHRQRLFQQAQQGTITDPDAFKEEIEKIDNHIKKVPEASVVSCLSYLFNDSPDTQLILQAIASNQETFVSHLTLEHLLKLTNEPGASECIINHPKLIKLLQQSPEALLTVAKKLHGTTTHLSSVLKSARAFVKSMAADPMLLVRWAEEAKEYNDHIAGVILQQPLWLQRLLNVKDVAASNDALFRIFTKIKATTTAERALKVPLLQQWLKNNTDLLFKIAMVDSDIIGSFASAIAAVPELANLLNGEQIVSLILKHPSAAKAFLTNNNVVQNLSIEQALTLALEDDFYAFPIIQRKNFELKHLEQLWKEYKYYLEPDFSNKERTKFIELLKRKRQERQLQNADKLLAPKFAFDKSANNKPAKSDDVQPTLISSDIVTGFQPPQKPIPPSYHYSTQHKSKIREPNLLLKLSIIVDLPWKNILTFLGLTALILLGIALCLTGKGMFLGVPILTKVLPTITSALHMTTAEMSVGAMVTGSLLELIAVPMLITTFFKTPLKNIFNAIKSLFITDEVNSKSPEVKRTTTQPETTKLNQPAPIQTGVNSYAFNPYINNPYINNYYPVIYVLAQPAYFVSSSPITGCSDYRPTNGFTSYLPNQTPLLDATCANPTYKSPTLSNNA